MTRKVARIDDALADPLYEKKEDAKVEGNRSMMGVPLMREGEPVVVIGMGRRRLDPFGEREIELAKSFAAQAVIAIENARLLNELRQRTTDLRRLWSSKRLRQRCSRLSSGSPGDLEPVFATMLEKAARICDAKFGKLYFSGRRSFALVARAQRADSLSELPRQCPIQPAAGWWCFAVCYENTSRYCSSYLISQLHKAYIERHPVCCRKPSNLVASDGP